MAKIAILFGSTTGNTEDAAREIHKALGGAAEEPRDIAGISAKEIESYDHLILGASTWGAGDIQDDWAAALGTFDSVNLAGKKVAIFGLGDQYGYADSFVDAIGEIAEKVRARGGEVIGHVSTDGYEFDASRGVENGRFLGLPLDVENQNHLSPERVAAWVAGLQAEMV